MEVVFRFRSKEPKVATRTGRRSPGGKALSSESELLPEFFDGSKSLITAPVYY